MQWRRIFKFIVKESTGKLIKNPQKPNGRKKTLLLLLLITLAALMVIVIVLICLPGPSTLVVNDTVHDVQLIDCGPGLQVIPGDVVSVKPSEHITIGSGKFQKINVCDVYYTDNSNADHYPNACLVLPRNGGNVYIGKDAKPYSRTIDGPCDMVYR